MLASGSVGFGQECEGVVYAGDLHGLAYLPLVILAGSFHYSLPDVLREHLVGIGGAGQFTVHPGFCDFLVSVYPVIYEPSAFGQGLVGFLDSLHSLVGFVDRVAAVKILP